MPEKMPEPLGKGDFSMLLMESTMIPKHLKSTHGNMLNDVARIICTFAK